MANPSLQIGNDNWAIKEDNLLGYSTAGTRFVPQPIAMTRATVGTRVNPSGLVEDVALLGDEEVTNGDFATDSDWNKGTGITIGSGVALFTSVSSGQQLSQSSIPAVSGKTYKISYEIKTRTEGAFSASIGGALSSNQNSAVGVYTEYLTATGVGIFYIRSRGTTSGSIDNISVKEATIDNLPRVDYTDGTSSLLAEPQRRNLVTYSEVISNLSLLTGGAGTYTITDNYTNSPEGVQNASRVQMSIVNTNDGANYSLIALNSSMTNGVTREISFYAKSLTGLNQEVLVYWSTAKQIVTLTNDWQRFEISATSDNSGAVLIGTRGGATQYYAGGGANLDFALWGLQVEDDGSGGGSSYATSYIPTSGSTVTRNQEVYKKTGISDKINSEEGVLFLEIASLSESGNYRELGLSDGTSSNRVLISYKSTDNVIRGNFQGSGGTNLEYTVASSEDFHKIAVKWKVNDFALWVDGVERATDTSGSSFPADTLNSLNFNSGAGGDIFYGKVKQLQVFKTALSDSELETLTT